MANLILEDVFNEAKYPEITFVYPKEWPQIKSSFRAQGKHITISGPSGSGKTTSVLRLLREFHIEEKDVLLINCRNYTGTESFLHVLAAHLKVEPSFETITAYLKMVKFIVVDDFHHLSSSARIELAKNLKLWHENQVRFIIIGIAISASELVGTDAELGIRNDPFQLKTQDDNFVKELINLGEKALEITFSDRLKNEIVTASNGVPSVVHVICRIACIESGIEGPGTKKIIDHNLTELRDSVLRIFHAKYFDKVVGLAKGKQQARSVHNTYFDIISLIIRDSRSEFPVEFLYQRIVGTIQDPKQRSRKATSFYNCFNNLDDIISSQGMNDMILYKKGANNVSIEDPSLRFYLNLLDIETIRERVHIRDSQYAYDVAVSFAGDIRNDVVEPFIKAVTDRGITPFYDFDQQALLWGKNLREKLADVYANEALYMVVFMSKSYPERDWTNFELAVGKKASEKRTQEYLLPIKVDDTLIVGLNETVGSLDIRKMPIEKIADILSTKINQQTN